MKSLDERFVVDLLTSVLKDDGAREDMLNLLSFTSDDRSINQGQLGAREAKSWALKLWWKIMYNPVIGKFMYGVIDRHNMFWVKRETPLSKVDAASIRNGQELRK